MNPIGGPSSLYTSWPFLPAVRTLHTNQDLLASALEHLATGSRINRGADDPAGMIASENLRAALATIDAESRSLERADAVVSTADGALGQMSDLLVQAEGLTVASANEAGVSDEERAANRMEIDSLVASANRIARTTTFNGDPLFDGTAVVSAAGTSIAIDAIDIASPGDGEAGQTALAAARSQITTLRGRLGAFSHDTIGARMDQLGVAAENVAAAESAIRDTDYAAQTADLARLLVLARSSMQALGMASGIVDLLG